MEKDQKKKPQSKEIEALHLGLVQCKNCLNYVHPGNYCEQCGKKLITIHHFDY